MVYSNSKNLILFPPDTFHICQISGADEVFFNHFNGLIGTLCPSHSFNAHILLSIYQIKSYNSLSNPIIPCQVLKKRYQKVVKSPFSCYFCNYENPPLK